MSDQDKNPIIAAGGVIVTSVKALGRYLSGSPVCRQCSTPVHPNYEFCSEACGLEYWKNHHCKTSGHKVCGYPGCSKQCYVEPSGRVHDYCSRTHATEHKVLQDQAHRHHWQQQQPGSSHHPRTQSDHSSSWGSRSNKHATGPINFYNRDDPYYEFTNFYSAPIKLDMKTWPTTEHYFQAQKFVGTPYEEQIRCFSRPRQAFDFTRDPKVSRWRRNDWESIKEDVMYKALLAKFTQHNELKKLLLGTGERKLIEHSPYDSYWGDGGDGTGMNRLGELLMRLRRELRSGWRDPPHQQDYITGGGPSHQQDYTPTTHQQDNTAGGGPPHQQGYTAGGGPPYQQDYTAGIGRPHQQDYTAGIGRPHQQDYTTGGGPTTHQQDNTAGGGPPNQQGYTAGGGPPYQQDYTAGIGRPHQQDYTAGIGRPHQQDYTTGGGPTTHQQDNTAGGGPPHQQGYTAGGGPPYQQDYTAGIGRPHQQDYTAGIGRPHQQDYTTGGGPTTHQQDNTAGGGPTIHQQNYTAGGGPTIHQQDYTAGGGPTIHQQDYTAGRGPTTHQQDYTAGGGPSHQQDYTPTTHQQEYTAGGGSPHQQEYTAGGGLPGHIPESTPQLNQPFVLNAEHTVQQSSNGSQHQLASNTSGTVSDGSQLSIPNLRATYQPHVVHLPVPANSNNSPVIHQEGDPGTGTHDTKGCLTLV